MRIQHSVWLTTVAAAMLAELHLPVWTNTLENRCAMCACDNHEESERNDSFH